MTTPASAAPSIVDVDAAIVFRRPLAVVLLMTFLVGALDAVGYERYGVFTANQAGNLVIIWTLLAESPAAAGLALASVVGCGLGVAAVVLSRRLWGWLATARGSRWLLAMAALLLVVAHAASPTWAPASIALVAFSIGVLGMVFISGGGVRAPILASTNAYVDAVRYGIAGLVVNADRPALWAHARRAAGFPLCWTAGAAVAALLPVTSLTAAAAAGLIVVVVAVFGGRTTHAVG